MVSDCTPHHDLFNTVLTLGLCCGLVISYLPQHYRIIHIKSSEGLSPTFLLLGVSSALLALFNMITLQAPIVRCCTVVSYGTCLEISAGLLQLGLQFVCFTLIFILYMIYYPEHLKYITIPPELQPLPPIADKKPIKSDEWRISIAVAWFLSFFFAFIALTTAYLLTTTPESPSGETPTRIAAWATLLGVGSAVIACVQYAPQLIHTYRAKLVGALSIPMMMIQAPGGVLMVLSIALRPGTNWTSWATFAVAAILQGCLLAMCIVFKIRQNKEGVDDFGVPVELSQEPGYFTLPVGREEDIADAVYSPQNVEDYDEEPVPGLVGTPSVDPVTLRVALHRALQSAQDTRLLSPAVGGPNAARTNERTPLLRRRETEQQQQQQHQQQQPQAQPEATTSGGWLSSWFGR